MVYDCRDISGQFRYVSVAVTSNFRAVRNFVIKE